MHRADLWTRTPPISTPYVRGSASYLIDDGNINSKPAWSLDGQTIYFHRMVPPDYRFKVFRIGPDGSGLRDLTAGAQGISEHPSN